MHPSEYYVRYFLAKNWAGGHANHKSVSVALNTCGLLPISEQELTRIQATFVPPSPFLFNDRKHAPTIEFMKAQRIFTLWDPQEDEKGTIKLLEEPSIRECIQTLLMGRLQSDEIAKRVSGRFKMEIATRTVEAYAHYFWNVGRAGLAEWTNLLYGHPMRDHYLAALTGSPNQALFRAGFSPHINGKSAMRELHRSLSMRIEATRRMPDNRDTALMLSALSKALIDVHNALFGEGAGLEEQIKELARFKMEKNNATVIPLRKLAKTGSFSGSGKGDDK